MDKWLDFTKETVLESQFSVSCDIRRRSVCRCTNGSILLEKHYYEKLVQIFTTIKFLNAKITGIVHISPGFVSVSELKA